MSNREHRQEKARQLGCAVSTASAKLYRSVLFALVKRLGEDKCWRCGKAIETAGEFSLDHKKPWLHGSVALFWDVGNISFSHRRCNSGARRSRTRRWIGSDREYRRAAFAAWYAQPKNHKKWNKRRRELYRAKKAKSASEN